MPQSLAAEVAALVEVVKRLESRTAEDRAEKTLAAAESDAVRFLFSSSTIRMYGII